MAGGNLKVGIVGEGRMGITHHSIINSRPDVQVTAIADPSTVVNTLIEKYVKVRTYKNAADMLDREPLQAILVCTPPALNFDILSLASRKGIHAFVEKPFMLSSSDGFEIAKLFDEAGLVNQAGYVIRFNCIFVKVKQYLDEGLVGRVVRIRNEMYSSTIIRPQEESGWRASHASGGGVIYEMSSHAIDLMNFLFGRPAKVIGTCTTQLFSKTVEDIVSSAFLYRTGAIGSLYVNWSDASFRKPASKLEIFGEKGKIVADQHGIKVFLTQDDDRHGFTKGWNNVYITDIAPNVPFYVRGLDFTDQLYHFVDKIQSPADRRTRCSFADAAETMAVIEEVFRDSENVKREFLK